MYAPQLAEIPCGDRMNCQPGLLVFYLSDAGVESEENMKQAEKKA